MVIIDFCATFIFQTRSNCLNAYSDYLLSSRIDNDYYAILALLHKEENKIMFIGVKKTGGYVELFYESIYIGIYLGSYQNKYIFASKVKMEFTEDNENWVDITYPFDGGRDITEMCMQIDLNCYEY